MKQIPVLLFVCAAVAAAPTLAANAKEKPKAPDKRMEKPAAPTSTEKGRDWTLIDTNKDGYISPEEMEVWLKANPGPQR